jgi:hypothetical protein
MLLRLKLGPQKVVIVGKWSLFGGGRWLRFDCNFILLLLLTALTRTVMLIYGSMQHLGPEIRLLFPEGLGAVFNQQKCSEIEYEKYLQSELSRHFPWQEVSFATPVVNFINVF